MNGPVQAETQPEFSFTVAKDPISSAQIVHLSNENRKLVLYGYIRKTYKDTPLDVVNLIFDFYGLIRSNLKGDNNPLTIQRMMDIEQGIGPDVYFDDNVSVYTVPDYDRTWADWMEWYTQIDPPPPTACGCCCCYWSFCSWEVNYCCYRVSYCCCTCCKCR